MNLRSANLYPAALLVLAAALPAVLLLAAGTGAYPIPTARIPAILWSGIEEEGYRVLVYIRMPRVVLAALVGAVLAVSGAGLQTLFRNALADPGLIGVSGGASLAASAWIVLAGGPATASIWGLPVSAFLGGLAVVGLVWRLSRTTGAGHTSTLLLTGIALNAIVFSVVGLLTYLSDDAELREMSFWQMGSLGGASWPLVVAAAVPAVAGAGLLVPAGRQLNALALGEEEAFHLGIRVRRLHRRIVLGAALAVGGAVAAAGGVGFIGLVVPHLLRLALGADNRMLLPGSALAGAILLVAADTVARTVAAPAEVPVGIITALGGGPFFLWLIWRHRRQVSHA